MRTLVTVVVAFLLSAAVLHDGLSADSAPRRPSGAVAPDQAAQTPHDIDSLVAPIALYPDQLLAQILVCAGDPASVTKLNGWLKANQKLKGSELQDAAVLAGFEPSFVALALFPTVIGSMAAKLDWTTLVGQVFIANRSVVFASIQKLRAQAREAGTLKTTPQQDVETRTTSSGQQVIVIEPANPQVIYVPQYNPTVVYTQAPTTTTVVVENTSSADAAAAGLIGFTAGIAIGAAVNNNYYYGPHGWYGGGYMYNDAWNDYYDAREDARDDWQDHREDLADERGDRAGKSQEQRTERQQNRTENRPESRAAGQTSATQSRSAGTAEARGYSQGNTKAAAERSGTKSDAFSGYSSGRSERAASSRGTQSRSSSGSRGGGGRRR